MNLKDTYDKIALNWQKDHVGDDWSVGGTRKFESFLKPNSTILDVGCGSGLSSKRFSDYGFDVTGIDFSGKMIEAANKFAVDAKFKVLDIRDLGKIKENFDGIYARAVLLHFSKNEIPKIIQSLCQKLNDGGYIYIAVKEIKEDQPDEQIVEENDYGFNYERFFSYFTMNELEKFMTDCGLNIVFKLKTNAGDTGWIQIIGKK